MLAEPGPRLALLVSLLMHAALLATAAIAVQHWLPEEPMGVADSEPVARGFAGETFEIDSLVEGEGAPRGTAEEQEKEAASGEALDAQAGTERAPLPPPAPAERPPAPVPPKPPSPSPGSTAAAPPGDADGSSETTAGLPNGGGRRYGAAGVERGVTNLAGAFARALPAAVSADRVWSRLPLGAVGILELAIVVDGDGKLVETKVRAPDPIPKHLRRIVDRTTALLRSGRFALTGVEGAGEETLRVEVVLSERAPIESRSAKPHDALELGHELPLRDRPGRAYFTLASGRHFEAKITIVSSRADAGGSSEAERADADAGQNPLDDPSLFPDAG